mgnify:CR=1 FL=1
MKKLMLALAALALMATAGFAATGVAVQWDTSWGVYDHAAVDLTSTTTGGILDSYAITWQLIYSLDNVADAPNAANGANGWVSNDDEVWATRTFAQDDGSASDGTEWDMFVFYQNVGDRQYLDTAWAAGDVGYIFQRVFEGAPAANSWYFDSTPVALDADPETYQENYIEGSSTATIGVQPNQQIGGAVPEPATMGLLGLGALVMAIRRRRA